VGVDGGVSSRPSEIFVLPVWNVQVRLRVAIFLGETKVDDIHLVAPFADAHEEVVGLNVAVDEVARVNILDTGDELVAEKKHGLQTELPVAEVEEVLE
jgi:hypothetical protein